MKIMSDDEALNYIDTTIRNQLSSQAGQLGAAHLLEVTFGENITVKEKFGIGHHSDKEKVVHAWAYAFEGQPELSDHKKRWLIDTGETVEATKNEAITKIQNDNPDFDASTPEDRKLIRDFLHGSDGVHEE